MPSLFSAPSSKAPTFRSTLSQRAQGGSRTGAGAGTGSRTGGSGGRARGASGTSGGPLASMVRPGSATGAESPAASSRHSSRSGTGAPVATAGPSSTMANAGATSDYLNTAPPGLKDTVLGLPLSTFIATILAAVFYALAILLLLVAHCPFDREVGTFFGFLCVALIGILTMVALQMNYTHYRFNCLSLSMSLLYSGSAFLVLYGLLMASMHGLCKAPQQGAPKPQIAQVLAFDYDDNQEEPGFYANGSFVFGAAGNASTTRDPTSTVSAAQTRSPAATTSTPSTLAPTPWPADGSAKLGIWSEKYWLNYVVWLATVAGLAFQVVAHYYYG